MFVDSRLAARIDRAEGRMCASFAEIVGKNHPEERVIALPISGGTGVYAGPGSPMNKLIGLCLNEPLNEKELETIEREWRERNEPVRVEISALAVPDAVLALSKRGYQLHGFENLLGLHIGRPTWGGNTFATGVTVNKVTPAEEKQWLDIVVTAFLHMDGTGSVADEMPPREVLEKIFTDLTSAKGFTRYIAKLDGKPVGGASMRIDERLAQISGAGTLPEARGRGVQKALLQQRLDDARLAGCDLAVVTTAPGTRSQDNVMRRGFELFYTRAIMIKNCD